MRRPKSLRVAGRTAAALSVVAFGFMPFSGVAFASGTASAASANALDFPPLVTTGTETATNDGSQPLQQAGDQPALSILPTEGSLTAGVLQQTATAANNGDSSACAGLIGNGAEIQIGDNGICSYNPGNGELGGITLGGPTGIVVNIALETCEATPTGNTYTTQVIGLTLGGNPVSIPPQPIPANDVLIPDVLELNRQVTNPDGSVTATAVYVPALDLSIGNVTCTSGAQTGVSSAFPTESWPIVLGTLVVMGLVYLGWSRRKQHTTAA
jgi:hypothetical protein